MSRTGPVQRVHKRLIVVLGRRGVGKSSLCGCLLREEAFQSFGLDDGNLETSVETFQVENYTISVFDTRGWTGIEKEDMKIFNDMKSFVQDEGAKIQRIIFCISAKRFTTVDQNILNFLQLHASDKMKSLIHVVVTHAPEFEIDEKLKAGLKKKLSFLMKTDKEFEDRVSYVDFVDPRRFQKYPEIYDIIVSEWASFRQQMIDLIKTSDKFVVVRDFQRTSEIFNYIRFRRNLILITTLLTAIAVLILLVRHYFSFSIQLKAEKQQLQGKLNDVQSAFTQFQSNFSTIIAVSQTAHTAVSSVTAVFWGIKDFLLPVFV
jgi:GTP-binding protein EngB required for normal cell division